MEYLHTGNDAEKKQKEKKSVLCPSGRQLIPIRVAIPRCVLIKRKLISGFICRAWSGSVCGPYRARAGSSETPLCQGWRVGLMKAWGRGLASLELIENITVKIHTDEGK